ncbi:protein mono-ADP-ribosyltransferase PARP15-like, partial [Suncus etruscus]|uniref:protein mono-ADP-ribosyltransferase PARP15-like n=1 Tax=Suncus etruscus TaxID=109475 RepID=UPI002110B195
GDVTCFATNAIVDTVPSNLQLRGGPLSQSLLHKGGPMLQKELNATMQETQRKVGSIFMTSGCNLNCKAVFHVVVPAWNYGTDSSLQIMANINKTCLKAIEQFSFSSVRFPVIGTGGLMFPKLMFADLILSEVFKFSSTLWQKTLQEVHFVVLPNDYQGHQAFLDGFTKRSSEIFDIKMKMLNSGGTTQALWDFTKKLPPPTNKPLYFGKTTRSPIFQACGENVKHVVNDVFSIQNLTDNGQHSCSSEADCIKYFNEKKVMVPFYWSNMDQQNFFMEVLPSHEEYQYVANQFKQSCSKFTIIKIKRIQNLDLWNTYQIRKEIMDAKNGNIINEKQLFHGTDVDSVPYINRNGFNRSYAGKNGSSYGKGTYFAVNAKYSAKYSKPDAKGNMYMYYVRVLTGIYTAGNYAKLIAPPPKNDQNPTDLYDTVTDNVQNPKLFVVFYDYQAYPEYLITFKDNF